MTAPTAEVWDAAERAEYEREWLRQFRELTPVREIAQLANSQNPDERERGMSRLDALVALCRPGGARRTRR